MTESDRKNQKSNRAQMDHYYHFRMIGNELRFRAIGFSDMGKRRDESGALSSCGAGARPSSLAPCRWVGMEENLSRVSGS